MGYTDQQGLLNSLSKSTSGSVWTNPTGTTGTGTTETGTTGNKRHW